MKDILMSKGFTVGCTIAGYTLLGVGAVGKAVRTDKAAQELFKLVAKKVIKNQVGA